MLSITDDTIAGVNTIQPSGTGYTTATLTPASLIYVSTPVGSSNASQTATLTNTGQAAMTISSIALSGAAATSYTDTTTCGTTLAVGAICTIAVPFKPTITGTLAATLSVTDNATGGKQTVALSGTAVEAATKAGLSPTSLAFGSQTVAGASAAKLVRFMDANGTIQTVSFANAVQDPVGVAVDPFGTLYMSQDAPAAVQTSGLDGNSYYFAAG